MASMDPPEPPTSGTPPTATPPPPPPTLNWKRTMSASEFGKIKGLWKAKATHLWENKSVVRQDNLETVQKCFSDDRALFAPLVKRFPKITVLLSVMLVCRKGDTLVKGNKHVDKKKLMDWDKDDCERAGKSIAWFVRVKTDSSVALFAWRKHHPQLNSLFIDVPGFEMFMYTITEELRHVAMWVKMYKVG